MNHNLEKATFTLKDIAKVMYRVGVPEYLIATELCSLADLPESAISIADLSLVMREAYDETRTDEGTTSDTPPHVSDV